MVIDMRDDKQLQVWSDAHRFVLEVYRATAAFPLDERFGLSSQLRRSAVSIPSNIAEGAGRRSQTDYAPFLDYALGSSNECEAQLLIARDLELIDSEACRSLLAQINSVRRRLIRLQDRVTAPARGLGPET